MLFHCGTKERTPVALLCNQSVSQQSDRVYYQTRYKASREAKHQIQGPSPLFSQWDAAEHYTNDYI